MKLIISFILAIILSMSNVAYAPTVIEQDIKKETIVEKNEEKEISEKKVNVRKSRGPIPIVEKKNIINTNNMLFIGNSLIYGIDSITEEHTFISKIGITIKGLREQNFYDNLKHHSLDTVIIELGTNELGWFGEDNFKEEFDILITKIRSQNRKSNIILMTIPPVSESRDLTDEYFNNKNVQTYNKYIYDIAQTYDLMVIDTHEIFGDVLAPENTDDGIHLRGHNYEEWYNFIIQKIEKRNSKE